MKYNVAMPNFYTRRGDDGTSGLLGDMRVPKDHPRLEAVGVIDEASAALGVARATSQISQTREVLLAIQRDLYALMAEIAATPENAARFRSIGAEQVGWLEAQIERVTETVSMPKEFIAPGDCVAGANLDLARTIVRRAERRVTQLAREESLENPNLLRYLNRLSSLCFALELLEIQAAGQTPIILARKNRDGQPET